eukprot:Phypoly_transcript_16946.p1 GENE.Phypoly_transcript_16946~~Phypoly_transcript_16946.p1  ORF type:complete len:245 (+),score=28.83 Phypoly_transcript_16946:43-735(+)
MRGIVVFVGLLLVGFCTAASKQCFVIGVEQNFYPGYSSVTLEELTTTYSSQFLSQYNSYGLDYVAGNLSATNCLMTIGELQCIYPPTDTGNFVVPFTKTGTRDCVWSNPIGPVKLGTWNSLTYYPTLSQATLNNWKAVTCPSTNYHYILLVSDSCSFVPTPPPAKQVTCCYYYSHTQSYEGYFCQQYGVGCPTMDDYYYVGNATQLTCADCSLQAARKFAREFALEKEQL